MLCFVFPVLAMSETWNKLIQQTQIIHPISFQIFLLFHLVFIVHIVVHTHLSLSPITRSTTTSKCRSQMKGSNYGACSIIKGRSTIGTRQYVTQPCQLILSKLKRTQPLNKELFPIFLSNKTVLLNVITAIIIIRFKICLCNAYIYSNQDACTMYIYLDHTGCSILW